VSWTIDKSNKTINFTVNANTTGWVGLGLSRESAVTMKKADIAIFGVYNGKPYLTDLYAPDNARPSVDLTQNLKIHKAVEKSGWTNVTFSRGILSTDKLQDVNITAQRMVLIGAYGTKDYEGNTQDPTKHPYHGTQKYYHFGTTLSFYSACGKDGHMAAAPVVEIIEEGVKHPKFGRIVDANYLKQHRQDSSEESSED